jgi:hypothetical protein
MIIKSFRGRIVDNGIDTVALHTNDGSTGYKIVKLQGMTKEPYQSDAEHVIKIFSVPQTSASDSVDFSDNTLLAVIQFTDSASNTVSYSEVNVVFDNMVFNQDIYITHVDARGSNPANYYIELEQVKLDLNENTVATLKDIRNIASQ